MSAYVNLNEAKRYLRVDFTEDNTLVQELLDDTESRCENYLNLETDFAEWVAEAVNLSIFKLTVKRLLALFYAHRSGGVTTHKEGDVSATILEDAVDKTLTENLGPHRKVNV